MVLLPAALIVGVLGLLYDQRKTPAAVSTILSALGCAAMLWGV